MKGVRALAGSDWSAEVGDKLSSGTAFSWFSPVVNHDLGSIISGRRDGRMHKHTTLRYKLQSAETFLMGPMRSSFPIGLSPVSRTSVSRSRWSSWLLFVTAP
jgi:hypothetical protein